MQALSDTAKNLRKLLLVTAVVSPLAGCKQDAPTLPARPSEPAVTNQVKKSPLDFTQLETHVANTIGVTASKDFGSKTIFVFSPDAGGGEQLVDAQFSRAETINTRFEVTKFLMEGVQGAPGSAAYAKHNQIFAKLIATDPAKLQPQLTEAIGLNMTIQDPHLAALEAHPGLKGKFEGLETPKSGAVNLYGFVGGQIYLKMSAILSESENDPDHTPLPISVGKQKVDFLLIQQNLEKNAVSLGISGFPHFDINRCSTRKTPQGETMHVLSPNECDYIHTEYPEQFMNWFTKYAIKERTNEWWKLGSSFTSKDKPILLFIAGGSNHINGDEKHSWTTLVDYCNKNKISYIVTTALGDLRGGQ